MEVRWLIWCQYFILWQLVSHHSLRACPLDLSDGVELLCYICSRQDQSLNQYCLNAGPPSTMLANIKTTLVNDKYSSPSLFKHSWRGRFSQRYCWCTSLFYLYSHKHAIDPSSILPLRLLLVISRSKGLKCLQGVCCGLQSQESQYCGKPAIGIMLGLKARCENSISGEQCHLVHLAIQSRFSWRSDIIN